MNNASTTSHQAPSTRAAVNLSHDDYRPFLKAMANHHRVSVGVQPMFETDVSGTDLWNAWLTGLPPGEWQGHNCHSCRRFVERYGNLVTIDAKYERPMQ